MVQYFYESYIVGESHEDSYEEPSTERSWPPRRSTTTRPPPRRTEDQERSSNDDSTNQIADRIFDKLMNAAHGDASLVLSGIPYHNLPQAFMS